MSEPKCYFTNNLADYEPHQTDDFSEKYWKHKISETISTIVENQPPSSRDCDGGLYVGCSGIGYMLYHVSRSPVFVKESDQLINQAQRYMSEALEYANRRKGNAKTNAAFLLGSAGVYAVSAAISHYAGDSKASSAHVKAFASTFSATSASKPSADELFVGRAGQLAGALWLNRHVGKDSVSEQLITETRDLSIESGRKYARANHSPAPLMYSYYDTEYLGAAHGLCSILQMLLSCPAPGSSALADVRASVDYLLTLQSRAGNFPCALDEVRRPRRDEDQLVHWCHGAPGVVYLLAKAWLLWRDDRYLTACLLAGDLTWRCGLLRKGPGICHGVAGSGYVFLLLHRLTRDPKHLHRARQFAAFIFSQEFQRAARTPDCPWSLYEGLAGTVCFLTDMLAPETAAFPFQDVF